MLGTHLPVARRTDMRPCVFDRRRPPCRRHIEESHFWRQNSYCLRRQGLVAVFEATRQFCRDRIQVFQARTLSAPRDGGWSRDGEWVELPKNGARRAMARRHGSTVAKDVANFSNHFAFFEASRRLAQRRRGAKENTKIQESPSGWRRLCKMDGWQPSWGGFAQGGVSKTVLDTRCVSN